MDSVWLDKTKTEQVVKEWLKANTSEQVKIFTKSHEHKCPNTSFKWLKSENTCLKALLNVFSSWQNNQFI